MNDFNFFVSLQIEQEIRRIFPDFGYSLQLLENSDFAYISTLGSPQDKIVISLSKTLERLKNCHDVGQDVLLNCLYRVA
jgi:hypothetical protein